MGDVIVSSKKPVSSYITACMFHLHDKGVVTLQATGSAIEKLVRTVSKIKEMLDEINVDEVNFEEVEYNGKKKARLKVVISVSSKD